MNQTKQKLKKLLKESKTRLSSKTSDVVNAMRLDFQSGDMPKQGPASSLLDYLSQLSGEEINKLSGKYSDELGMDEMSIAEAINEFALMKKQQASNLEDLAMKIDSMA